MTAAGTADVRELRSAVLDALVVGLDHLVVDLRGFRSSPELRQAVLDLRDEASRRRPRVVVDLRGLPWPDGSLDPLEGRARAGP
jgi:hypothetical protein